MSTEIANLCGYLIEVVEDSEAHEWIAIVEQEVGAIMGQLPAHTRTLAEDMVDTLAYLHPETGGDTYEDYMIAVIADLQTIREETI